MTVDGETVKPVNAGALIVNVEESVVPANAAEIDADVFDETALVLIVKLDVIVPAATMTVAGMVALGLPEVRLIDEPPAGAAELNVTVPVDELPPSTVVGLIVNPTRFGAVIERVAN